MPQRDTYGDGEYNFYATGTHKVILSGVSKQTVSFASPYSNQSHFNILDIRNTSSDGVFFATSAYVLSD